MNRNRLLLAAAATSALLAGATLAQAADRARQGCDDLHADGRQPRRGSGAGAPDRRRRGGQGARRGQAQRAVLAVGAGEDDRAVQAGDGGQADLHRHHGPSRLGCVPRSREAGGRAGHRRHRRQLAADAAAEGIRHQGLRLCRRRSLCRRHADRERHDRRGPPQGRRSGDGLWRVQPGRARPVGKGPGGHAGEGRAEGRSAGDHAGSQLRPVARDPGADRLRAVASAAQGDRHAARRRDRRCSPTC